MARPARRPAGHRRRHPDRRAVLRGPPRRMGRRGREGRAARRAATSCATSGPSSSRLLAVLGGRGAGPQERHLRPARTRGPGPASAAWRRRADVVCENFRPGTLEEWGIGPGRPRPPAGLRAHQRLRPGRPLRGTARARPARRRLRRAAAPHRRARPAPGPPRGHRGRLPHRRVRRRGGAGRAVPARRRTSGRDRRDGAVVDASLYGSVLRILEWTIPAYDRLGTVRAREGNRLSNSAPLDNYPTADGRYVCVVAGSDANFAPAVPGHGPARPARGPPLRHPGRPRPQRRRDQRHRGRLDVGAHRRRGRSARASPTTCLWPPPTAPATSPSTPTSRRATTSSPVDDPVLGPLRQQAPYPRLVGEEPPGAERGPAARGAQREVWCDLVGLAPTSSTTCEPRGSCERPSAPTRSPIMPRRAGQ